MCPRGVMVKAMACGIVISEFVLQSRYYVRFRANTLGKGMNPLILPAMGSSRKMAWALNNLQSLIRHQERNLIFPWKNVLWSFKIYSYFSFKLFLNIVLIFMLATVIIIIIMSRYQQGSPWPSLATRHYRSSLPRCLQDNILYRHRAVVYRF